MSNTKERLPSNILLMKNLPKKMDALTLILSQLQPMPTEIKSFGRRRALLYYDNAVDAVAGLQQLQALTLDINVSHFYRNLDKETAAAAASSSVTLGAAATQKACKVKFSKSTQTTLHAESAVAIPAISQFVRQLYACDAGLDFAQPPPPQLRYAYPRITPDILDSISIALMSNTRFYTQVLHLMNRMNLEPPFAARTQKFVPPGEPCDASTQTLDLLTAVSLDHVDEVMVEEAQRQRSPTPTEESELESSGDEQQQKLICTKVKRKTNEIASAAQYKKKARLLLQSTLQQQQTKKSVAPKKPTEIALTLQQVFEAQTEKRGKKIELNLKKKNTTAASTAKTPKTVTTFVPPADLSETRLSLEQQQQLPIFKSYAPGEACHKLYIKNLAKDVDAAQLQILYARFVDDAAANLEVKVMQSGRMKGQAFITFATTTPLAAVEEARSETNGFLLQQKPMVVCFGRK